MNWFDPSKIASAQQAQGAGADGRTVLQGQYLESILNPLSGVTGSGVGTMGTAYQNNGGGDVQSIASYTPGSYSANGQTLTAGLSPSNTNYASEADYNAAQQALAKQYGLDPNGRYAYATSPNPTGGASDVSRAIYSLDANGNAVPVDALNSYSNSGAWVGGMRDWVKDMAIAAGSIYGAGALSGAGGAGTEAGGAAASGGGGGLSSSDLASLYSDAGYGATGAATGAEAAGTAASTAASPSIWSQIGPMGQQIVTKAGVGAATSALTGGNPVQGAASGAANGAVSGYGDSTGGSLINGISNAQLGGIAGGLLGAATAGNGMSGLNSASSTSQNQIDPRIAQYLYGSGGQGGLLGNVSNIAGQQFLQGGLNPVQQQGLQMQYNALMDPAYAQGLAQTRATGMGLLGPQAGNPFTSGQTPGMPPMAQMQTQPSIQGWRPMATQLNPQGPNMTGLLGNLRPHGA